MACEGLQTGDVKNRRGGDSNPRYGCPHTGFRNQLLQPLGHLSRSFLAEFNDIMCDFKLLKASRNAYPPKQIQAMHANRAIQAMQG